MEQRISKIRSPPPLPPRQGTLNHLGSETLREGQGPTFGRTNACRSESEKPFNRWLDPLFLTEHKQVLTEYKQISNKATLYLEQGIDKATQEPKYDSISSSSD